MQIYDHLEEVTANLTWYTTNCKWLSSRKSRVLQVPRCLAYFFTELVYASVYPKFDELRAICDMESLTLCVLPRHGSVMTLLKLNAPSVDTPVRCDRNRHGGGVALFISNKLEFNGRP